jgi:hypothetical protein
MLFSDIERKFEGPKPYAEPDYEYLDRSARKDASCIRSVLEEWFLNFPESNSDDLLARFKSANDLQHISASFELYLYALINNFGYEVEIHPQTNTDKDTHPDFKAIGKDGFTFYLEAVQSTDTAVEEQGANARLNVFYDTINRLESRDFFLDISFNGLPNTPPPGAALRKRLSGWLASLNADKVIAELESNGPDSLPQYEFSHEGWDTIFRAIPRSPEKRGSPVNNIIGSMSGGARWLSTWESIRDSLIGKGNRYGELDHPLIVAVNANVFHLDRIDIMQALFGQEQYIIDPKNIDKEPRMERAPNGLWYWQKGARYKRISGVLIGFDIKPWTYGVRKLDLYLNPWANRGLNGKICTLPVAEAKNDKMVWKDGQHPKNILRLPECYPGVQQ